ncbi:MAG: MurR/RpiR family transcriptional regulator [Synergistaceae bacterium]|jgi:DNA-binding MurR/RpiR family transcriptional regulator|nr:MurR/RpiR family transcriptional regulator [Synergistaceae bacterium]
MSVSRVEKTIRARIDAFPPKTRRVAEYLLANQPRVAFSSISEVANKLDVSKAQLVRVARMLGFKGYSDLRGMLQQALLDEVSPLDQAAAKAKGADLKGKLRVLERANIDETCRHLSDGAVKEFCLRAEGAEAIYCMGWGISALVAEWAYTRFAELGLKAVLARRGSMSMLDQTRAVGAGDMLVVCELPSYVIEVTEAVEKIRARGAFVVTITDGPAAPVCGSSNLSFHAGDVSPTFGSSIIGPMFAVHVLTSALALHLGEQGKLALAAQKEVLNDERVYYPAHGLRY